MRDCPTVTSALPEKGILSQTLPQSCYLKLGKSFEEHFSCCSMPLFLIKDKSKEVQNSHCCKNQPMVLPLKTPPPQICPRKIKRIAQVTLSLIFPNFLICLVFNMGLLRAAKKATPGGKIAANSVTLVCQNISRANLHIQKNQLEVLANQNKTTL